MKFGLYNNGILAFYLIILFTYPVSKYFKMITKSNLMSWILDLSELTYSVTFDSPGKSGENLQEFNQISFAVLIATIDLIHKVIKNEYL